MEILKDHLGVTSSNSQGGRLNIRDLLVKILFSEHVIKCQVLGWVSAASGRMSSHIMRR